MSPAAVEASATFAVDQSQYDNTSPENATLDQMGVEPIAIIGLSAQFPQDADSPEGFWQLLMEGRSAMTEIPADRFNIDSFYHPNPNRLDTVYEHDRPICH